MSDKLQRVPAGGALARSQSASHRFQAAFAAFLADLESEASQRAYSYDWELYRRWLEEERSKVPAEANTGDVQAFLLALREGSYRTVRTGDLGSPLGRATRNRTLSVIRAVYGVFVRAGLLSVNPAREAKVKKADTDPRTPWFGEEEFKALIRAAREGGDSWRDRRNRSILFVLLGTGLRRTEVANLRRENLTVQGDRALLSGIIKGGKEHEFPLPHWVYEELRVWVEVGKIGNKADGPIFPSQPGSDKRVSASTVYAVVKNFARAARVDPKRISPHAIRRTLITLTGDRGVSLKARQAAVGHVSQQTTERYDKAAILHKEVPGDALADLAEEDDDES